jgi:hypothetical protein
MISLCIFFIKGACKKKKKTQKYTLTTPYDLIDIIDLFPYWSFEKLIWHFDFKNILMFIVDILLVE